MPRERTSDESSTDDPDVSSTPAPKPSAVEVRISDTALLLRLRLRLRLRDLLLELICRRCRSCCRTDLRGVTASIEPSADRLNLVAVGFPNALFGAIGLLVAVLGTPSYE